VLSLGMPLFFDDSQLGLSLIHAERKSQEDFIVSASYSRSLGWNDISMRLNTFRNFGDEGGFGAFASFAMPLGEYGQTNAGVSRDRDGNYLPSAGLSKPMDSEIGSFGYRANVSGTDANGNHDAGVSYRSKYGVADMRLSSYDGRVTASGSFDGSLVAAGGGIFVANTIHDSFAVVDAGVPDVPVLLQNRPVTKTGGNGKALVSGLRSYARNKVSIDVSGLPVDAIVSATDMDVVPARRSGVTVKFDGGIKPSALVVLRDSAGAFVPPGAVVKLNGGETEYYVGYDGQAWLEDLEPKNRISVELETASCAASFGYAPDPGKQVIIDPVECT
jgi:outer membrane usher protein